MSNLIVFEALVPTMHGVGACVESSDFVLASDSFTNIGLCIELEDAVTSLSYRRGLAFCSEALDLVEARPVDSSFGFCIDEDDSVWATSTPVIPTAAISFFSDVGDIMTASGHFFMVGSGSAIEDEERVRGGDFVNAGFGEEIGDTVSAGIIIPYMASFLISQTPGHAHMEVTDDGIDTVFGLTDTMRVSSRLITTLRILLRETLRLQSTLGTTSTLKVVLTDGLRFNDRFAVMFLALLQDTLTLDDNIALRINMIALVDALILSGTMQNTLTAKQVIASMLTLRDALDKKFVYTLDDDITLSDTLAEKLSSTMKLIDTMTMGDSLNGTGTFAALMSDTINLGDSLNTRMDAIARMADEIDFVCRLYTDNGERIAWAFNTVTSATSQYENFAFNSVCELDGVFYASSDTGLYALGSDDDDGVPISAYIESGLDTLGSTYQKRLVKAYLHFRSDGDMLVSYVTTESGVRSVETYRAMPVMADDFRETEVDVPAGKKAVFWAFRIANENGADFDLSGYYTIPLICGSRSNG